MNAEQLAEYRARASHIDTIEAMCNRPPIVGPLLDEVERLTDDLAVYQALEYKREQRAIAAEAERDRLASAVTAIRAEIDASGPFIAGDGITSVAGVD